MYLSSLLVEDGIRHLFSYQSNSVSSLFSSYSLACVSVPSSTRHLRSWTRCPPRAPFLITPLLFLSILSWTTNTSRSRHLSYSTFGNIGVELLLGHALGDIRCDGEERSKKSIGEYVYVVCG